MKKTLTAFMLTLAVILGLTSCNTNDGPEVNENYFLDIVNYEADSPTGSTFTFRRQGDSELITLTCPQRLSANDFKVGTRVIINYVPESGKQYVSGPVRLVAAANVEGRGEAIPRATKAETDDWASDGITVHALFRSGNFINLQFTGALGAQKAVVKMLVDSETIDSDTPEVYIIYGPYTGVVDHTYMFYGSWSIADIWNRPNCKAIRINFKGMGTVISPVTIAKSGSDTPSRPVEANI